MEKLMTVKDVAEVLNCSARHVQRLRDHGLKSIKLGDVLRFRAADVQEFLNLKTI